MRTFLRLEALGFLAGSVALHVYLMRIHEIGNWWAFALFAIGPDLSLLAFLKRGSASRWACLAYNVVHMYTTPIFLCFVLWPYRPSFLLAWVAHIAVNRLLGFDFKSPVEAKPTGATVEGTAAPENVSKVD